MRGLEPREIEALASSEVSSLGHSSVSIKHLNSSFPSFI
jgi:hypothetical protein